jgi:mono/diheme cytochrome c family protein
VEDDRVAHRRRRYEKHCSVCHGGAARRISLLRTKFSPPVPQIVNRVPRDPDAEFYWITKHGVRMSGMPAWDGILTDAQIWTVVAFIKRSNTLPAEAQAAWNQAAGVANVASNSATPSSGRSLEGASK